MKKSHSKPSHASGKSMKSSMHSGGNMKLPNPSQAVHVSQQKDKMSKNVSNHMQAASPPPAQPMMESSGKGAPKKMKAQY